MPKTTLSFYLHIIAVAVVVFAIGGWFGGQNSVSATSAKESVYDRVMRTKTIRCGYHIWEPFLMKDINTGTMSGIYYDYLNQIGKTLSLKVEWVEETGFGPHVEALQSDRFDMMCAGDYQNAARGRYIDYTTPILYVALGVYTRADDKRFDHNLSLLNDASVKLSSVEGTTPFIVGNRDFPKAQKITHPESQDLMAPLMDVASGKADATITGLPLGYRFNAQNPGKIRQVTMPEPIRLFGSSLSLKRGQIEMQNMINNATRELQYSGVLESIIKKYEKYPGSLYRVTRPYQAPQTP
ncbi:MAG: transporter substrate-binding domain-containing protein [Alphaproteobacteria bacterium]|nr:MAG: transporter substrate-binding domain-containing protein [Alphaproteobacteria bacterium]